MALKFYYHPLASYCWKPLIALYENGTPFEGTIVDLGDEKSRTDFYKLWPMGQFPVLVDSTISKIIPQSSIIIEYLSIHYAGKVKFFSPDPGAALEARRWDDFFDSYLQTPMQKIVGDCLRPEDKRDPAGVAEAHQTLLKAYGVLEEQLKNKTWAIGEMFSIADCSAYPALFYANKVEPFEERFPKMSEYLERLGKRPSIARVHEEAKPFFHLFPYKKQKD